MPAPGPSEAPPSLLVCSYEFGQGLGAEGICTERLVRALLDKGWSVTVATSDLARPTLRHERLRVHSFADRPGTLRFAEFLDAKLRLYFEPRWVWRRRVCWAKPGRNADFVYARSSPFTSLLAGAALARRLGKPYGLHFSDPYPNPWEEHDRYFGKKLAAVKRLIKDCSFLTFVTEEALDYVQSQLPGGLRDMAFVLPHVAPEPRVWDPIPEAVFLYAGRFYGRRRPDQLLDGFRLFAEAHPRASFHYVGPDTHWIKDLCQWFQIEQRVQIFPPTADIESHFAAARVLVATDANDQHPVFLTTKLIEYLSTNRQVLLVSPPNSPGSKLVARFPVSALRVAEDPLAIAEAMERLCALQPSHDDFAARQRGLDAFSPANIADTFIREVRRRLPSPGIDLAPETPKRTRS